MATDTATLAPKGIVPTAGTEAGNNLLIDPYDRHVSYLRVSVTDRCDFRCVYCMSENMTFLPKSDVLSLEELDRLCSAFVTRGVRKLRISGGEPLVRRDIMWLFERLGRHLDTGALEELTLTTNGKSARTLCDRALAAGVRRINCSIDTLDPDKFAHDHPLGQARQGLAGSMPPRRRPENQDQRGRPQRASTTTKFTTWSPGAATAGST